MSARLIFAMRAAVAVALLTVAGTEPVIAAMPQRYEFSRIRMGVPFRITVYADDEAAANAAASEAFGRVEELNLVFSDYDRRSEASRLSRGAKPGVPMPVSGDMLTVLLRSQCFAERSDGAFDVTVGSVTKLWRIAKRTKELPTSEQLERATSLVGYRQLSLDRERRTVAFDQEEIRLDFGGIACGYACDEMLNIFRQHGLSRVLIESSGDIIAGDPPPGRDHWTIGVGSLAKPDAPPEKFIALVNRAVTTSGDAYQFVEFDGVRYSHIVDPKTGLGLTTRSSATVIAADCTTADALATAVSVIGPKKGLDLIESFGGVEMLMVTFEGETPQIIESASFEKFIIEPKSADGG